MGLHRFTAALLRRFNVWPFRSAERSENPAHRLGRQGEKLAARYLRRNGYRVLYRNFRAPHGGEVDLVCRDKRTNTLVFVEVKTRSSTAYGAPADAVDLRKQKLIARGALAWLRMLDNPEIAFRFDILEIVMVDGSPQYNLIQDAFALPEWLRY